MNVSRICLRYQRVVFGSERWIHGRKSDKQSFVINVDESRQNENNSLALENEKKDSVDSVLEPKKPNILIQALRPSTDYMAKIQKRWDVSPGGIRRWLKRRIYMHSLREQSFVPERLGQLGADLSSATFILKNNGKVQFNDKEWVSDIKLLPTDYSPKYKLTAINATGNWLLYEGIENLIQLKHLRELNVSNNLNLDDWCCDLLSRINRHSKRLETLDISGCKRITDRGVASLVEIPTLKTLNITNTKASEYEHLELLIFLFNDINPNCEIINTCNKLLNLTIRALNRRVKNVLVEAAFNSCLSFSISVNGIKLVLYSETHSQCSQKDHFYGISRIDVKVLTMLILRS